MQSQEELPARRAKTLIPGEAYQLAESHRLGKPTAYYRSQHKGKSRWYAFFITSFFLALDALLFCFLLMGGKIITVIICSLCICLPIMAAVCFSYYAMLKKLLVEASAMAYFCQLGFIYKESEQLIVLRWEEIERVSSGSGRLRNCEVMLGNGATMALVNAVGGDLREQIRRRLLRARKKHQHGETF
ncbi:MAG TPA: DUF6585 family protein [Ktedonobacteraceae bacterium]|nr:DUF6585 family protein [Ktedonobacteraceae bacterium]